MTGTITPGGALEITLSNISGRVISRVDITGTFVRMNAVSMNYIVQFLGGGANAVGTVTLNRA